MDKSGFLKKTKEKNNLKIQKREKKVHSIVFSNSSISA